MSKLPYLVIAVILLMSLAACSTSLAGGEPWPLSQSANGITLRWWSDELADAQAAGAAGAYCTRTGRAAETISIERDGSASIGHYRCV